MAINAIAMTAMRCSFERSKMMFDHPANAGRDEPPVAAAGHGLDADAERLTDLGQPLAPIAEVAERRTFEATRGERAQRCCMDRRIGSSTAGAV
jgi:hypothetical protein